MWPWLKAQLLQLPCDSEQDPATCHFPQPQARENRAPLPTIKMALASWTALSLQVFCMVILLGPGWRRSQADLEKCWQCRYIPIMNKNFKPQLINIFFSH